MPGVAHTRLVDGRGLRTVRAVPLAHARLDGHKGTPLTFDAGRRLLQPLCIVGAKGELLGVVDAGDIKP